MPIPSVVPTTCRYPLDDSTSATIYLPDGRKLGYAEYGSPTGKPVLYMPGFPSSRIEGAGLHHMASKLGVRIISLDRPGYGWSSPHRDRTVLSTVQDVGFLADHLKLEKYGVLGISGGGPYALACARTLPTDKLCAVSIVCGLGSPDMTYSGMKLMNWAGWTFGQRLFPSLCRWWFSRDTGARLDLTIDERMDRMHQGYEKAKGSMDPRDKILFGNEDWMWMHLRRSEETFRQGVDGLSQDFRLLNSDFGFKIEDIRKDLPFQIWHGRSDVFVPLQHAEKVAARLGENVELTISDDTHASIYLNKMEEYMGGLVRRIEA